MQALCGLQGIFDLFNCKTPGKTELMAGDRLTVMTDEQDAGYIHDKLENLCYTSF